MTTIPTDFVPGDLDATTWEAVEPFYRSLMDRGVGSSEDLEKWIEDRSELEAACSESRARLYINMTCDTGDEAAAGAYSAYIEHVAPKLEPATFGLDTRQAELAEELGLLGGRYEVLHRDTKAEVELFREENVPLKTRVEQLSQDYQTVIGAMSVEFDGETRTLPQMGVYQESADRAVRESAWRATAERRLADAEAIDGVFDGQIKLRDEIARNAGCADYVEYAFRSMHRFDYTPADCAAFHASVESVVMPFCARLDDDRREKLGIGELGPWDLAVDPLGRGPLRPFKGGADLVNRTRRVMEALDPELASMFATLGDGANTNGIRDGALLDLDSRAGKAPGGYQYMQDRTRVPFIFMNAAGLHRDVETMVHEAGHAFHSMLCNDEPLLHYRESPIEFAEVASMTMELLTMRHWGVEGGFYPDPTDHARAMRKQLEGALSMLTWIATIDAFQHWLYSNPRPRPGGADRRVARTHGTVRLSRSPVRLGRRVEAVPRSRVAAAVAPVREPLLLHRVRHRPARGAAALGEEP